MRRKVGDVKRKSLAKGLYRMKISNTIEIDGEKGNVPIEALAGYYEKY